MKTERISRQPVSNSYTDRSNSKPFFPAPRPAATPFFLAAGNEPHEFIPGRPAHDHPPRGNWEEVQTASKEICESTATNPIDCACAIESPSQVMLTAFTWEMMGSPLAKAHLNH